MIENGNNLIHGEILNSEESIINGFNTNLSLLGFNQLLDNVRNNYRYPQIDNKLYGYAAYYNSSSNVRELINNYNNSSYMGNEKLTDSAIYDYNDSDFGTKTPMNDNRYVTLSNILSIPYYYSGILKTSIDNDTATINTTYQYIYGDNSIIDDNTYIYDILYLTTQKILFSDYCYSYLLHKYFYNKSKSLDEFFINYKTLILRSESDRIIHGGNNSIEHPMTFWVNPYNKYFTSTYYASHESINQQYLYGGGNSNYGCILVNKHKYSKSNYHDSGNDEIYFPEQFYNNVSKGNTNLTYYGATANVSFDKLLNLGFFKTGEFYFPFMDDRKLDANSDFINVYWDSSLAPINLYSSNDSQIDSQIPTLIKVKILNDLRDLVLLKAERVIGNWDLTQENINIYYKNKYLLKQDLIAPIKGNQIKDPIILDSSLNKKYTYYTPYIRISIQDPRQNSTLTGSLNEILYNIENDPYISGGFIECVYDGTYTYEGNIYYKWKKHNFHTSNETNVNIRNYYSSVYQSNEFTHILTEYYNYNGRDYIHYKQISLTAGVYNEVTNETYIIERSININYLYLIAEYIAPIRRRWNAALSYPFLINNTSFNDIIITPHIFKTQENSTDVLSQNNFKIYSSYTYIYNGTTDMQYLGFGNNLDIPDLDRYVYKSSIRTLITLSPELPWELPHYLHFAQKKFKGNTVIYSYNDSTDFPCDPILTYHNINAEQSNYYITSSNSGLHLPDSFAIGSQSPLNQYYDKNTRKFDLKDWYNLYIYSPSTQSNDIDVSYLQVNSTWGSQLTNKNAEDINNQLSIKDLTELNIGPQSAFTINNSGLVNSNTNWSFDNFFGEYANDAINNPDTYIDQYIGIYNRYLTGKTPFPLQYIQLYQITNIQKTLQGTGPNSSTLCTVNFTYEGIRLMNAEQVQFLRSLFDIWVYNINYDDYIWYGTYSFDGRPIVIDNVWGTKHAYIFNKLMTIDSFFYNAQSSRLYNYNMCVNNITSDTVMNEFKPINSTHIINLYNKPVSNYSIDYYENILFDGKFLCGGQVYNNTEQVTYQQVNPVYFWNSQREPSIIQRHYWLPSNIISNNVLRYNFVDNNNLFGVQYGSQGVQFAASGVQFNNISPNQTCLKFTTNVYDVLRTYNVDNPGDNPPNDNFNLINVSKKFIRGTNNSQLIITISLNHNFKYGNILKYQLYDNSTNKEYDLNDIILLTNVNLYHLENNLKLNINGIQSVLSTEYPGCQIDKYYDETKHKYTYIISANNSTNLNNNQTNLCILPICFYAYLKKIGDSNLTNEELENLTNNETYSNINIISGFYIKKMVKISAIDLKMQIKGITNITADNRYIGFETYDNLEYQNLQLPRYTTSSTPAYDFYDYINEFSNCKLNVQNWRGYQMILSTSDPTIGVQHYSKLNTTLFSGSILTTYPMNNVNIHKYYVSNYNDYAPTPWYRIDELTEPTYMGANVTTINNNMFTTGTTNNNQTHYYNSTRCTLQCSVSYGYDKLYNNYQSYAEVIISMHRITKNTCEHILNIYKKINNQDVLLNTLHTDFYVNYIKPLSITNYKPIECDKNDIKIMAFPSNNSTWGAQYASQDKLIFINILGIYVDDIRVGEGDESNDYQHSIDGCYNQGPTPYYIYTNTMYTYNNNDYYLWEHIYNPSDNIDESISPMYLLTDTIDYMALQDDSILLHSNIENPEDVIDHIIYDNLGQNHIIAMLNGSSEIYSVSNTNTVTHYYCLIDVNKTYTNNTAENVVKEGGYLKFKIYNNSYGVQNFTLIYKQIYNASEGTQSYQFRGTFISLPPSPLYQYMYSYECSDSNNNSIETKNILYIAENAQNEDKTIVINNTEVKTITLFDAVKSNMQTQQGTQGVQCSLDNNIIYDISNVDLDYPMYPYNPSIDQLFTIIPEDNSVSINNIDIQYVGEINVNAINNSHIYNDSGFYCKLGTYDLTYKFTNEYRPYKSKNYIRFGVQYDFLEQFNTDTQYNYILYNKPISTISLKSISGYQSWYNRETGYRYRFYLVPDPNNHYDNCVYYYNDNHEKIYISSTQYTFTRSESGDKYTLAFSEDYTYILNKTFYVDVQLARFNYHGQWVVVHTFYEVKIDDSNLEISPLHLYHKSDMFVPSLNIQMQVEPNILP